MNTYRRIVFIGICFAMLFAFGLTIGALSDYDVSGQLIDGRVSGNKFIGVPGATVWLFYIGDPNPVATSFTDQEGRFEFNNIDAYDVVCPYQPGLTFDPVYLGLQSGGIDLWGWSTVGVEAPYWLYFDVVTPDRKLIEGVDVTFSGESIGTMRGRTINSADAAIADSLLTFTPEIPYSSTGPLIFSGPITVSVSKPGWTFEPSSVQVEGSRYVMFVGNPISPTLGTPTTSTTPGGSARTVPQIEEFIVDQLHLDRFNDVRMTDYSNLISPELSSDPSGIAMWHNDYVELRGPITVAVREQHTLGTDETRYNDATYYVWDAPRIVTIPLGETMRFENSQFTSAHPGDWNMDVVLLSVDDTIIPQGPRSEAKEVAGDISGTWTQTTCTGSSLWTFTKKSDGTYAAKESGLGGASGDATYNENSRTIHVRWKCCNGQSEGDYTWNLEPDMAGGDGSVTVTKKPEGDPTPPKCDSHIIRQKK